MADRLDQLKFSVNAEIRSKENASPHYIAEVGRALEGLKCALDEGVARLHASADADESALCAHVVDSSVALCALALQLQLLEQMLELHTETATACNFLEEIRSILRDLSLGIPHIGESAYDSVPDLYPKIASAVSRASTRFSELGARTARGSTENDEFVTLPPPPAFPPPALDSQSTPAVNAIGKLCLASRAEPRSRDTASQILQ